MSELKEKQYVSSVNFNARVLLHYNYSTNKRSWPLWIFDNITLPESARVLEIGCGNGLLWKMNSERIPEGWDITLTDFSEGMLRDAEKFIGGSPAGLKFRVMDAESIPYDDCSFDIIFANHMMYHINDRKKAMREIRRTLQSDGTFYASTMESAYMGELTDIMRGFRSLPPAGKRPDSLISNFSLENGGEQLGEYFNHVVLKIYENSLVITEAEPFTDYVISLNNIVSGKTVLNENERSAFSEYIEKMIIQNGYIRLTSNSGIFICKNLN